MKQLLSLALLFFAFSIKVSAQSGIIWEAEMNVAANSFDNLHPRVVLDRNALPIIIWGKLSTKEVYFSKWDNAAAAFTAPVALNPPSIPLFTASWAGPDIASHGDTVYVVMKETPEDVNHMYIATSFDGGMNFAAPVQIDQLVDSISRFPTVGTDSSGNPIVAYMNFETGFVNASYVVSRSNDYGNTFNNAVLASQFSGGTVCDCCPAAMVSSGNTTTVLYRDNLNNLRTMWAGISTDNGISFPSGLNIDHTNFMINACPSSGPDGIIIGDSLYTVYMSGGSGSTYCYMSRTSISGMNAGSDIPLNNSINISNQNFPRIANAGNKVAVVCKQTFNGMTMVPLFYSEDIASETLSQNFDTIAMGNIENADVVMSNDSVFVVWEDNNSGTVKFRKGLLPNISTTVKESFCDEISVFPSPATDFFHINLKNIKSVEMFDKTGRMVTLYSILNPSGAICHFEAGDGIYLLKTITNDGKSHHGKIVVGSK